MRRPLGLLSLLLLAPAPARGDTLVGTRGELKDRTHAIELRISRGHATLVVRRTFENPGSKHDQAVVDIDTMPHGAVATGLRTLGSQWFDGELLDAEVAAARYKYLTGIGGYYPKDPALLSWRTSDHLKLQVFPLEPKALKSVEYTLEAPTTYENGQHTITLPAMGTSMLSPTVTVRADDAKDALAIDGVSVTAGTSRRLADSLTFSIAAHDAPKFGGRFASVGFAKGRALLHTAIELAPKLSELPKDAYVVVLVDASRSVRANDRDAELAAASAYLAHLPDAHVAIVPFDRALRPIHTSFVAQKQALAELKTAKLTPRNGSDLDTALADALSRLEHAPANAPRRILLLTDLQTRSNLLPEKLRALDFKKALLHVATVRLGAARVSREDADGWAEVPRSTGGVLWNATASNAPKENEPVFEEWARPLRIDRLAVKGVGLNAAIPLPDSLAEGTAFDDLRLHSYPTPALEITGELWSTKTSTLLSTNATEERLWSALVFGSDVHEGLSEKEMSTLAVRGHAVSPMTSFLAIEPGVRPSTEGLEEGFGFGSGSGRLGGRSSKVVYVKIASAFDHNKFWREKLAKIATTCNAGPLHARLETTLDELVAVEVQPKTPNDAARACVANATWELELPPEFSESFRKFEVDL